MTKTVFLSDLSERLLAVTPERISPSDAVRSLDYYGGWIDSRMKDGMGEEEAVAALGQPEDVLRALLASLRAPAHPMRYDRPVRNTPPAAEKKRSAWPAVLAVLTSPVWIPLLIAGIAVLVSLAAALWAVVVSLWAVWLSLAVSGVACVAAFVPLLLSGDGMTALFSLGVGIAASGLSILFWFIAVGGTKLAAFLTVLLFRPVGSLFARKERKS